MWETCSVNLEVHLPRDIAAAAEEVQQTDPEFLSRVVLYGLTRRTIFEELRLRAQAGPEGGVPVDSMSDRAESSLG